MLNPAEMFGISVFNESVMRERLPKETFKTMKKAIDTGTPLTEEVAHVVAAAMKAWAIEKGATHYTHWFQPMTGVTAEKHDAFITPAGNGKVLLEFSGNELIKGEPDASSFPSGGLRSTFEARGYTAWDATSPAFIKDATLCIPTAFCSYSGEALDKKTPLLRSMDALSKQASRILTLFHTPSNKVISTIGAEQEYFLIDKALYEQRKDLIFTGRTLFGSMPPKGQELEDHYFGNLKERVSSFMAELNEELWKLGVLAKTKHNEVAPAQHELAPIFTTTNIATDHNQLTMELMHKVALRHGLVCLLHEKPFAGVNGSGKHNNWSISTDSGENLLEPGKDPSTNTRFLLFIAAIIKGVDLYGDLIRVSVATAGNDHRLGANEAPPAIVSIFLGDKLTRILESIEKGYKFNDGGSLFLKTGVSTLPILNKDNTDRNRTSPFAFTGNKFEFRMPGSSQSISGINIVLNTIFAEIFSEFADKLEKAKDLDAEVFSLIKSTIEKHSRIIFNGNNYSDEWVAEAEKRGLPNLKCAVEALPCFIAPKNEEIFIKQGVFSKTELVSRYEILVEDYSKAVNIEALTMLEMTKREIIPACVCFSKELFDSLAVKKASGLGLKLDKEDALAKQLSDLTELLIEKNDVLSSALQGVHAAGDFYETAKYYHDVVFTAMQDLRTVVDELETIVSKKCWPFPTYSDLLFSI